MNTHIEQTQESMRRQGKTATAMLNLRTVAAQCANIQQIVDDIESEGMTQAHYQSAKRCIEKLADQVSDADDALIETLPRRDPAWIKAMAPATGEREGKRSEFEIVRGAAGLD